MLALVEKGLSRDDAYKLVQGHAMAAWEGGDFRRLVSADPRVAELLPPEELAACFDVQYHLRYLDQTFAKLGID
jgi:adenylosuccinate lyase